MTSFNETHPRLHRQLPVLLDLIKDKKYRQTNSKFSPAAACRVYRRTNATPSDSGSLKNIRYTIVDTLAQLVEQDMVP